MKHQYKQQEMYYCLLQNRMQSAYLFLLLSIHKKEQKERRIEKQDELIKEVKRHHKLSGEDTVRKEIPGLERTSMTWMRKLIYEYGA